MKENVKYVIDQLKKEMQYKKENGPRDVTVDQLWRYSGKVEPNTVEYANLLAEEKERRQFLRYYKKRLKKKDIFLFLNATESRIIDYFYKTSSSLSLVQMSEDLGHSKTYISKIISKHLKIQKNDKNNTGKLP